MSGVKRVAGTGVASSARSSPADGGLACACCWAIDLQKWFWLVLHGKGEQEREMRSQSDQGRGQAKSANGGESCKNRVLPTAGEGGCEWNSGTGLGRFRTSLKSNGKTIRESNARDQPLAMAGGRHGQQVS